MATVSQTRASPLLTLGNVAEHVLVALGDFAVFSGQTLIWMVTRRPAVGTFLPSCYTVGVRSVPVVAVTGMFIGMVMAVQFYSQFNQMGLATRLGSLINISIVRELGPVLAATMLAGRVGSAMAAELATMKITEQVDALAVLGVHPIYYLVVPRFMASLLLIPLLTVLADYMGVMGGAFICTRIYSVEAHHYWEHTARFIEFYDVLSGLIKATFFGGSIALISCYCGFHSQPGAEGVGRASTVAFVISFVVILILDLFLGILLINVHNMLWPGAVQTLL